MQIETVIVTPFQQNARLLVDEHTQSAVIVDPGGDVDELLAVCRKLGAKVERILLTHAHIDHAGGVKKLLARVPQAKLFAHANERELRSSIAMQALMFGLSPEEFENCPEPDVCLAEGDRFDLGSFAGHVLFTPGHSPGHISLYVPQAELVIAGDTLFAGSIGRTDLPGGDHELLLSSIREKLLTLPENTKVMSGHGPDTTIGREKRGNPFLR